MAGGKNTGVQNKTSVETYRLAAGLEREEQRLVAAPARHIARGTKQKGRVGRRRGRRKCSSSSSGWGGRGTPERRWPWPWPRVQGTEGVGGEGGVPSVREVGVLAMATNLLQEPSLGVLCCVIGDPRVLYAVASQCGGFT